MNRKHIAAVLAVGLLLLYAYLGTTGVRQRREQADIKSQIASVTQTLSQIPKPDPALEQRLSEVMAELRAEREALPGRTNTTLAIDSILRIARDSQVHVIHLSTEDWAPGQVAGTYLVFTISMEVEGTLEQTHRLMSRMESGAAGTARLRGVRIHALTGEPATNESPDAELTPVRATLEVVLFAPAAQAGEPWPEDTGQ